MALLLAKRADTGCLPRLSQNDGVETGLYGELTIAQDVLRGAVIVAIASEPVIPDSDFLSGDSAHSLPPRSSL